MPADGLATEPPSGIFDPVAARAEHMAPPEERVLSKKEEWLREKTLRPDFRISENALTRAANPSKREKAARAKEEAKGLEPMVRPGERIEPVTTLFNVWTHEALPILPGQSQTLERRFLPSAALPPVRELPLKASRPAPLALEWAQSPP